MTDTPVPARPAGLSEIHLRTLRDARHYVATDATMVPMAHYRDLLLAYDALAVRMAWLAALHAECTERYDGLS